jgi:hypothetical protein
MARVTLYYKDDPILSRMKDGVQYGWYLFMADSVSDELNGFVRGTYGWEADTVFKDAIFIAHHDLLFWE